MEEDISGKRADGWEQSHDDVQDWHIPFAMPDIGIAEAEAAKEVILSGWLTTGDQCARFEHAFAERVGAKYAVALNSCTAALHLGLEAVGVQRGDLVITTPYTFAATAEVIRYLGALPVLVDVDPATFNLDCAQLEDVVGRLARGDPSALPPAVHDSWQPVQPRAIVPVHIAGVPCDLDRIYEIAATFGIAVVEDAAHAFPSATQSRSIGSETDASVAAAVCFSFYATKSITTGEGGMLVTDTCQIADRARQMSLHGLGQNAWGRYQSGGTWRYGILDAGFKYNLTDIAAAIGLVQLARVDETTARRIDIAERYNEVFRRCSALQCPTVPVGMTSAWHLYMLRLHTDLLSIGRDRFIDELSERGVGTSVHFIPLHLHPYYETSLGYEPSELPVATLEYMREISLPIYSRMSDDDVERVCGAVTDVATRYSR